MTSLWKKADPMASVLSRPLAAPLVWAILGCCVLLASLPARAASPKPADSSVEWDIDDQPGYVPPAGSEKLEGPWEKQLVFFRSNEAPGTIVVHTDEKYLYLVQPNNRAIRYGIGVGREGFLWKGLVAIVRKQEWPDWRPPPEMIKRQPYLPRFMAGGPGNPMGARAMYLGGTVYRIHGTNQPDTIGSNVSSGCIRLINPDVMDLYERVPVGTKVIVRQAATL